MTGFISSSNKRTIVNLAQVQRIYKVHSLKLLDLFMETYRFGRVSGIYCDITGSGGSLHSCPLFTLLELDCFARAAYAGKAAQILKALSPRYMTTVLLSSIMDSLAQCLDACDDGGVIDMRMIVSNAVEMHVRYLSLDSGAETPAS